MELHLQLQTKLEDKMMSNTESTEYWRWTESRWTNPDLDWKDADIITAGIDVGSVSTQAVVMVDGKLYCYSNMRTGSDSPDSANRAINWALEDTGLELEKIHYSVGTGYGRVNVPFAQRAITEIACHARGANFMYGPSIRTVLDMGGQDCKAIRCDHRGKVTAFLMNDKCAAGTGRGMEVFADLLKVHINDVGQMSLVDEEPKPVSSTCVVFAKSEAVALLRKGWSKDMVLAAYCSAMAHRVVTLLERLGVENDFAITGGITKNIGVVSRIEKELDITAPEPTFDPQLAGAIGGALFGKALVEKQRKKT
jgi:bzd-type benzoyl-CoA reductase Q subunit